MCFGRKLAATLLMDTALYVLDLKNILKTFMVLPKNLETSKEDEKPPRVIWFA